MSQSEFSFSEHLQSPRENSYPGGTRAKINLFIILCEGIFDACSRAVLIGLTAFS